MTEVEFKKINGLRNPALDDQYQGAKELLALAQEQEKAIIEEFQAVKEYRQALKDYYKILTCWHIYNKAPKSEYDDLVRYYPEAKELVMPCDCVGRQCALTCPTFGENCLRSKEEFKIPQLDGFVIQN